MSKVCILSTVNIKHMTLVSLYTNYFDKNGIKYDIIYIDKYGSIEEIGAQEIFKFNLKIKREWSFLRKLKHYWKFKKFALKILKENDYDFIITWNVFTAIMFSGYLVRKKPYKFVVNIRDIATKFRIVLNVPLKKAIRKSAFSTVSSIGFSKYLPKYPYIEIHSLNMQVLQDCIPHTKLKGKDGKIVITYIGYVVYYDNVYRLIKELANDKRYELRFYGQGSNLIEDYARTIHAYNVKCIGRFEPSETANLIQDADIIYNLYGYGNINLDTALSIKLYYAVYLNVPILVFKNTYMEFITNKYRIGYALENNDFSFLGDNLYEWYHNLNQEELSAGCNEFIKEIKKSHIKLENLLIKYIQ